MSGWRRRRRRLKWGRSYRGLSRRSSGGLAGSGRSIRLHCFYIFLQKKEVVTCVLFGPFWKNQMEIILDQKKKQRKFWVVGLGWGMPKLDPELDRNMWISFIQYSSTTIFYRSKNVIVSKMQNFCSVLRKSLINDVGIHFAQSF